MSIGFERNGYKLCHLACAQNGYVVVRNGEIIGRVQHEGRDGELAGYVFRPIDGVEDEGWETCASGDFFQMGADGDEASTDALCVLIGKMETQRIKGVYGAKARVF